MSDTHVYRLRLLSERDRLYKSGDPALTALARRGLVDRTGRLDRFGREEWSITFAGREAAAAKA
ncbi:MAG: hypothetical protein INR70_35705, partial [Parafilimonas terrae]|nr:hypothetical protein [Parafilimonas terrae]